MEINFSPILTSKNYGINSAKIDDNFFCNQISTFENVKIENGSSFLKKNTKSCTFSNKIGEFLDEQLSKNFNNKLDFLIDKSSEEIISINFDLSEKENALVSQICFSVKENVSAKILIYFTSKTSSFLNCGIKFDCEKSAKVEAIVVCDFTPDCKNVIRFDNTLQENSHLDFTVVDFGAKASIENFYCNLNGDFAVSNLNCLYIGERDNFLDLNFLQDVKGKKCQANIETIGALLGQARKHFKGTINFQKGCKKSVGSEEEFCLLLSKQAKAKALPMLLCKEEDVEGRHSASVGKIDEKSLFYIMSRGFSYQDAVKLVVRAKFGQILDKISDESLKEKLKNIIDRKLSYEEN